LEIQALDSRNLFTGNDFLPCGVILIPAIAVVAGTDIKPDVSLRRNAHKGVNLLDFGRMRNQMIGKAMILAAAAALISVPVYASEETETEAEVKNVVETLGEIPETDLLHEILERGYLIVGTEGTYAPNTYHNEDDELVGFDVEVAALVAKYLGVDIKYMETEWASIFAALDAGQIDLIVNEVGYTEERAEKYDFSEPYAFVKAAILTRADDDSISSFDDLEGKTVANESTSLWGERALSYGANLDPVNAMAQSISEVLFERADATLNAETAFADYMSKHPDENVKIAALSEDAVSISYIPMVKGNEKLTEAVNAALECARESGELSEVSEKYFHVDVTEE
jgi:cystine transport system substrate-binding protein